VAIGDIERGDEFRFTPTGQHIDGLQPGRELIRQHPTIVRVEPHRGRVTELGKLRKINHHRRHGTQYDEGVSQP